jgi:hypothetical protein
MLCDAGASPTSSEPAREQRTAGRASGFLFESTLIFVVPNINVWI